MRRALTLACLIAASCQSLSPGSGWRHEVIADLGVKLGGCAVGDLDSERAGNEIAVVAESGAIWILYRDGDEWTHELAAQTPGEMIQCAIGDVDLSHPGDELVMVGVRAGLEDSGGAGVASLLKRVGGGWHLATIFEDSALLHAVAIGELDAESPGSEILVAGASERIHVLGHGEGGWHASEVGRLGGVGKSAVAFRGGAAIAGKDGTVVFVSRAARGWQAEVIDRADAGQARIGAHEATLVVARDDGVLALIDELGRHEVYREAESLRGAVFAELDPSSPGVEIATAGYSGRITVLSGSDEGYLAHLVAQDSDRLHHLTAGELRGGDDALELVGCGYSGKVHVVSRER